MLANLASCEELTTEVHAALVEQFATARSSQLDAKRLAGMCERAIVTLNQSCHSRQPPPSAR